MLYMYTVHTEQFMQLRSIQALLTVAKKLRPRVWNQEKKPFAAVLIIGQIRVSKSTVYT